MVKQDFELTEYIKKRMLEIVELEERSLFRQVVEEALLKVHDYNRQAYQELEKKVLQECRSPRQRYAISITMTDLKHYDATDSFMYPMCSEDTQTIELTCQDIQKELDGGRERRLYTVFIKVSASQVYKLCKEEDRLFSGIIKTRNREYCADFRLKKSQKYLKLIEELYSIFSTSGQPWSTVCTAYLNKLFDVYLVKCEELKGEEPILEIHPDLEEYGGAVEYGVIPLWNLYPIREKSSTYPDPCIDKINYEHQIFAQRLNPECEYIVQNRDVEITDIRRLNGDLFITCPEEKPWEWQLYRINQDEKKNQYPYPILSNQYKNSFSGAITEMYRMSIKTKGEMGRLMEAFPYEGYVQFHDFILCDSLPEEIIPGNYNMDAFIFDEFRINKPGQPMIIEFKAVDRTNYLNEDIMSFLVTQAQKILPDFLCMGRLIY